MKKRKSSLSLIAIAGTLVFASVTALTGCNNNSTQIQKFTVTAPSSDADYTITGLASEYAPGDTVSFTVTVNNTAKKIKTVTANGSAVNGTDGKYSFSMPSSNVTLAVTLEDKGSDTPVNPTAKELKATYSGTAQVGNVLTVTATYDGDPCTSFTLTDKSETAGMISISGSTISCLKEGKAKVEVSYSDAKTTLEIDIAKDACQSLKEIYKEVSTELNKHDNSVVSSKSYTTRAVITAIGKASSKGYCDIAFFDGETYGTLSISSSYLKDTAGTALAIGSTYRISGKMANYYGVLEFKNDTTNKVYMSFEAETNSSNFITVPTTPTAWTGTEFDAFKAIAVANNTTLSDAQKETGVPLCYVSVTATYAVSGSYTYLYVDGDSTKKISLGKTSDTTLGTLTEESTYTASMYVLGYNSGASYDYLNVIVDHIAEKKIAATSITINTPTKTAIDINETLDLTVTTDPVNANGAITWASSNTAIATVNDGKVTGIAAGSASITATITNADGTTVTSEAVEITVNEHVAACSVSTITPEHGSIALKDSTGADFATGDNVAPGELTIVVTPEAGYEVESVYYISGDSTDETAKTPIIADSEGNYKFTTEDAGSYKFGATFTSIAVTSIADAKKLDDDKFVKVVGKVVASEGTSCYINDGTTGIYIYNWSASAELDTGLTNGKFALDSIVEVYAVVGTNGGAKQLVSTVNKVRSADAYVKTSTETITTSAVTELTSDDDFKALTAADTGKKYKFKARFSKTSATPSSSTPANVTFVHNNTSITLRTSKYDSNVSEVATLVAGLTAGDYVEVETVLSWYNGYQFAFLGDGSTTITKIAEETATSITVTSDKDTIGVGQTAKLSAEVVPWNASSTGVTYEITAGSDYATISDDTLTGVAAGTVSVVAKIGELTSEAINIEVTAEAQTEVVHSVVFNGTNNNKLNTSYTGTFENTTDGITYVVKGMTNGTSATSTYDHVRLGHKNNDTTNSITTKNPFVNPIKKSTITFSDANTSSLTSAYLYVSTTSDFSGTDVQKYDIKDQIAKDTTVTTKITTPTANCYYKYEFVVAKSGGSSNGYIRITGLTFVE